MSPFLRFLASARSLASQGMSKEAVEQFAKNEFGKINVFMQKQIDNVFKPRKPVGKKDPDFDSTVKKLPYDDQGKPFNPRDPLKDYSKKADGGRIGYAMGSEGIMQMASAPGVMDERNELSLEIFGKELKLLTPEEMDMLDEEAERLMQKFSSAPDAMDERNQVMENIAIQEFGKPLKDLNEDEIIQIEMMIDEMVEKTNRESPSIKLADGGRAAFKDGFLARLMSGVKPDGGMFKSLFANKYAPVISGFNTSELFDIVTQISSLPGLADGGRIGYKDGPKDPRRRGFMKAAVGIASMLPFGATKIIGKAAPVIAKGAELAAPALNKIIDTVMTLGKTISQSGKRVKEMVTKKKHKDIEVEEDVMDGSYIIKKDGKEIYYKPGRRDEMGIDDDIIEVIDKTIKKAGGGIARMLGE